MKDIIKIILLPAVIFEVTNNCHSMNESNNENGLLNEFEIANDHITDDNFPNKDVSKFFRDDNPFILTKSEMNIVHNISQRINNELSSKYKMLNNLNNEYKQLLTDFKNTDKKSDHNGLESAKNNLRQLLSFLSKINTKYQYINDFNKLLKILSSNEFSSKIKNYIAYNKSLDDSKKNNILLFYKNLCKYAKYSSELNDDTINYIYNTFSNILQFYENTNDLNIRKIFNMIWIELKAKLYYGYVEYMYGNKSFESEKRTNVTVPNNFRVIDLTYFQDIKKTILECIKDYNNSQSMNENKVSQDMLQMLDDFLVALNERNDLLTQYKSQYPRIFDKIEHANKNKIIETVKNLSKSYKGQVLENMIADMISVIQPNQEMQKQMIDKLHYQCNTLVNDETELSLAESLLPFEFLNFDKK